MMDVVLKEKLFPSLRYRDLRTPKQHKMIFVKPFAIHVQSKFRFDIHNIFPLRTSFWRIGTIIGFFYRKSEYRIRSVACLEAHGNVLVPQKYKTPDGLPLGTWVASQRQNKTMPADRRKHLDDLGFVWKV